MKNVNKKGMKVMNQVKPFNHKQPWSVEDDSKIAEIAKNIQSREELERIAAEKAPEFGRTPVAVAKRIEEHKGWHYRQDGDKE
jgi:hypothetical protein